MPLLASHRWRAPLVLSADTAEKDPPLLSTLRLDRPRHKALSCLLGLCITLLLFLVCVNLFLG